jgi:ABC-2 type transport system ATP-binding protein
VADRIGILVDGILRVDCPTEHFKESIRKVVTEFPGRPPRFPACPGLVSASESGNRLELVIVNFGPEHEQLIASLSPRSCDVVSLNLEDAFVAYTRGSRPSIPTFEPETAEPQPGTHDRGAA